MASQIHQHYIFGQCLVAIQRGETNTLYPLIESHPSVLVQFDDTPFLDTPLHVAASVGDTRLVTKIMTFKPSLARKLNQEGFTPLHLALSKLLPDQNQQTQREGAESPPPDPTQPTHNNQNGALQILTVPNQNQPIQPDPNQPIQPDSNQPTQPLSALRQRQSDPNQHTQSDPSRRTQTYSDSDLQARLREVVHCLLSFNKDLVREKGKDGWTSLHYAAQIGELTLLIKFLITCPKSITDVTAQNETALHIALKQGRLSAFVLLKEWLHKASFEDAILWTKTLEKWRDNEGRTFLAIAKDEDLSQVDRKIIRRVLMRDPSLGGSFLRVEDETRRVLLTIGALLITLTFQATINPPGGTWKDDYDCNDEHSCGIRPTHIAGTAVISGWELVFIEFCTILSLIYSSAAVLLLLPRSPIAFYFVIPLFVLCFYFMASLSVLAPHAFPRVLYSLLGVVVLYLLIFLYLTFVGDDVQLPNVFRRRRHRRTGN